jgi:hypothetical protein
MSPAMASLHTTMPRGQQSMLPAPRKLTTSTPSLLTARPKRTTSTHVPRRARLPPTVRPPQRLVSPPLALFFL